MLHGKEGVDGSSPSEGSPRKDMRIGRLLCLGGKRLSCAGNREHSPVFPRLHASGRVLSCLEPIRRGLTPSVIPKSSADPGWRQSPPAGSEPPSSQPQKHACGSRATSSRSGPIPGWGPTNVYRWNLRSLRIQ